MGNKHDELTVYGIGKDCSKPQWKMVGDRLLELEMIQVTGEYGSLKLTDKAKPILQSEASVDMRATHFKLSKPSVIKKSALPKYDVDEVIFESLRTLRSEIAKETKMPAYIIFDNKTLQEIAYLLPDNEEKFLQINGVGAVKYEKYGEQFLALINTLRTNDFQELEHKKVAQVESKYEASKPKQPDAHLHKTYHSTLALIQRGLSVEEIMKNRDFATSTVLGHINKLVEENLIGDMQRHTLFSQVQQNPALDDWVKQGIDLIGSVESIQSYLAVHKQLEYGKIDTNEVQDDL